MLNNKLLSVSLLIGGLFAPAGLVQAASYLVSVNTQTLSGTTGSLDFQFNPGVGIFQAATATISNVAGGSYAGSQTIFGSGVTGGPITSPISIANVSGQDNEVLDSYHFGNSLTFLLTFAGPAISSPNGADTAGSAFAFSMFSDAAGTMPALTPDPNGIALTVNLSDQGLLTPVIASPNVTLVPEPSTLAGLAILFALLACYSQRKVLTGSARSARRAGI